MSEQRITCIRCSTAATTRLTVSRDYIDYMSTEPRVIYVCNHHMNHEITINYPYVISTFESPDGFNVESGEAIFETKTARATLATKKAAVVNKFIKASCMSLAEVALEDYYWHFGSTKGYRHLYRKMTMALHNARKEVK